MSVGGALLPLAIVHAIAYRSCNLVASGIAACEGYLRHLVVANPLGNVACKHGRLVAQRQLQRTAVGLAALVGDISLYHEMIEHAAIAQVCG